MLIEKRFPVLFLGACGRTGGHSADVVIGKGIVDKIHAKWMSEK